MDEKESLKKIIEEIDKTLNTITDLKTGYEKKLREIESEKG